jgi:hypothetical protein
MATVGDTFLNLADYRKRTNEDDEIATIIEQLSETNPILEDAMTLEGNLPTGHRTTIRTGLPSSTFRKLYGGVQPSKSSTKQVDDSAGMLEAYSIVDKALADLNGNTAEFRMSEARGFLESMNQTMADTLFYGNTDTDPEKFMGLAPRFDDTSAQNGDQIVDAGGTGSDNTSIWFVSWGEDTCHAFYPKGSEVGLQRENKGQETQDDGSGGKYEAYVDHFRWDMGLSVRDWRFISRIANIDVSDAATFGEATDNSPPIIMRMIDAMERIENTNRGNLVIYMNRSMHTFMTKVAQAKSNVNLTIENFAGRPVTAFHGVPIRRVDALVNTEAQVT